MMESGWTSTTLGQVCEINPARVDLTDRSKDTQVLFVPMAAVDDVRGEIQVAQHRSLDEVRDKSYRTFTSNDVLFAKITPCMENGKSAVVPEIDGGLGFGSTEFHVLRPGPGVSARFIWHLIRQERFRKLAEQHMTGSVGQLRVPADFLRDFPVHLPPTKEQERIVAALDSTIHSAHKVRQHLNRAGQTLHSFHQAVLAAACSGRLTEDWRAANKNVESASNLLSRIRGAVLSQHMTHTRANVSDLEPEPYELPASWAWASISDVCTSVSDGDHQAPPKAAQGIPFVVIGNLSSGRLDLRDSMFVPTSYYEQLAEKRRARRGDVLYTVTASYGIAVLVDTDEAFCFQRHIALLKPHRSISSAYLQLALSTRTSLEQATQVATGIAQLTVPLSGLRAMRVPVPPAVEQDAIVHRTTKLLENASGVEARISRVTNRAESLVQAVLAKVFGGELSATHDPAGAA